MGIAKRQIEERIEAQIDKHISKILGISEYELSMLNFQIEENASDDGLIYNYYIQFEYHAPKNILKKIKGLDSSNTVYFFLGEFS